MKILLTVEFYEPRKGGAEEVVRQVGERLAQRGHAVTVATSFVPQRKDRILNNVTIEQFKIRGNEALGIVAAPGEVERYQALLGADFDIIFNYAAQSWTTDLAFMILDRIRGKKVMVPCGYSGLLNSRYEAYFKKLPELLTQYDALIYASNEYQDRTFGEQHGVGDKAIYIPNGAGEEFNVTQPSLREKLNIKTPYVLLTVANHYVGKGHDFVLKAFSKFKRKDTTLIIVGDHVVSSGLKRVVHFVVDYMWCWFNSLLCRRLRLVRGSNRATVVAAYQAADLFLFGSRLECAPLVMYESFAAGVPFITRPVGNVADHRDYLRIIETPEQMSRLAMELLDNKAVRETLSARGQELWRREYTWDAIVKQYEGLFKKLCHK